MSRTNKKTKLSAQKRKTVRVNLKQQLALAKTELAVERERVLRLTVRDNRLRALINKFANDVLALPANPIIPPSDEIVTPFSPTTITRGGNVIWTSKPPIGTKP